MESDAPLHFGTMKSVGTEFSMIDCPDSGFEQDVYVHKTSYADDSLLSPGDVVSFGIHVNSRRLPQCSAPLWKLMGQVRHGKRPPLGDYIAKVRQVLPSGSAFLECPEVTQAYGRDCHVFHAIMQECGLYVGDVLAVNVHISESGRPQMSSPCWKCVSPENFLKLPSAPWLNKGQTWIDFSKGSSGWPSKPPPPPPPRPKKMPRQSDHCETLSINKRVAASGDAGKRWKSTASMSESCQVEWRGIEEQRDDEQYDEDNWFKDAEPECDVTASPNEMMDEDRGNQGRGAKRGGMGLVNGKRWKSADSMSEDEQFCRRGIQEKYDDQQRDDAILPKFDEPGSCIRALLSNQ